jgi:hypothetical protein
MRQSKMTTEAHLTANRANAIKSTGPRTLAGKTMVAHNAKPRCCLLRCRPPPHAMRYMMSRHDCRVGFCRHEIAQTLTEFRSRKSSCRRCLEYVEPQ